jgi:hypothetical protein
MRPHAVGLLAALTLVLGLLTPRAAHAQRPAPVPRIGVLLFSGPDAPAVEAFRHGLREHGWSEGHNLAVEWRYADGVRSKNRNAPIHRRLHAPTKESGYQRTSTR